MEQLSKTFLWGAATAASQYEGGFQENGRGLSLADVLPYGKDRMPVCLGIKDYKEVSQSAEYPSRIAVDGYHRWKTDIKYMAKMGLKCYRFSVSWTRIFPTGEEEKPNEDGIKFYESIIDELLENKIEPIVTLNHFDIPVALIEKYESWRSRKVIELYEKYCEVLLRRFIGKVKYWITFNEINMILHMPFAGAGICVKEDENRTQVLYQAAHHELVASARVVKIAHEIDSDYQMGCMLAAGKVYPYTCSPEDVWDAFSKDRENNFFIDVQARGTYPSYMLRQLQNNGVKIEMNEEDRKVLKENTVDFVSISYYSSRCTSKNQELKKTDSNAFTSIKNPYLLSSEWGWEIDPLGFRTTLNELYDRYQKPIFVVENGLGAVDELDENGEIHDSYRIEYLKEHICAMMDAVLLDGVEIIGYTAWSAVDIVSAATGQMKKRYGFVYVDRDESGNGSYERKEKDSFYWYKKVIATNGTCLRKK